MPFKDNRFTFSFEGLQRLQDTGESGKGMRKPFI